MAQINWLLQFVAAVAFVAIASVMVTATAREYLPRLTQRRASEPEPIRSVQVPGMLPIPSRRLEYDNARPERPIIGAELCDLPITDDDIRALVRDGAEIEYLNLNGTEISDETIPQLKQLNRLTHLNLAHTQITDAGLQQLADSGNLEYLSLTGTRINDDSLRYLRGLTNLKRLDLMHTSITDAGLKSLEELRKLRLIGFSGTRITDRGIRQLASKLPGLAETLREDDE